MCSPRSSRVTRIKTLFTGFNPVCASMNGYKYVHLDGSQLFFVGVCGFDIIFFTYYLLSYELDKQNTISDSLFTRPDYAIVLSIALFFRLLGVGLYLYRYQNLRVHWVMVGYLGIFLTAAGWYVLYSFKKVLACILF